MFVHLSIHYPRSDHEAELVASMHRFGAAAAAAPGLLHAATLKEERSPRLVGLTVWDSRAAWEAGVERSRPGVTCLQAGDSRCECRHGRGARRGVTHPTLG